MLQLISKTTSQLDSDVAIDIGSERHSSHFTRSWMHGPRRAQPSSVFVRLKPADTTAGTGSMTNDVD
jgi:hypothetical protein